MVLDPLVPEKKIEEFTFYEHVSGLKHIVALQCRIYWILHIQFYFNLPCGY